MVYWSCVVDSEYYCQVEGSRNMFSAQVVLLALSSDPFLLQENDFLSEAWINLTFDFGS